jgi:hypothetical protein
VIGKSSAEMMTLKKPEGDPQALKAYHIDVIVELGAKDPRRGRMAEHTVFREFQKPFKNAPSSAGLWKSLFSEKEDALFNKAASEGKRIFPELREVEVYLLDHKRALELELSRWADPASDERTKAASLDVAAAILYKHCVAHKGGERHYIRRPGKQIPLGVPAASVEAVEERLAKRYGVNIVQSK